MRFRRQRVFVDPREIGHDTHVEGVSAIVVVRAGGPHVNSSRVRFELRVARFVLAHREPAQTRSRCGIFGGSLGKPK